jgi:hypothetical protein
MDEAAEFFYLSYGDVDQWVATLGKTSGSVFDPATGKEDFSERIDVEEKFEAWRPGSRWEPQPICIVQSEGRKKYVRADRIYNGAVGPILSKNAVEKMRPLLEKEGHILPLRVVDLREEFFLWWVPVALNSVDFERSEKYVGKSIKKFVFDKHNTDGLTAFRPHHHGMYNPYGQGRVFVSDEFRQKWLNEGLTGILFEPV